MKRVLVVGSGGAGKSRLAAALGAKLDLPVVHLDTLYWRPGWVATPEDQWRAVQVELTAAESWIIDGNHASSLDVRLPSADAVIMLDLNRYRCLARALRRSIVYRWSPRASRAEGCREHLSADFLKWIWTFPREGRPLLLGAISTYAAQAEFIRLRSPREVRRFLSSLP
jgi:adenylate kinase family enzyme